MVDQSSPVTELPARMPTRPRCARCQQFITIDTDADDDLWAEVIGERFGPGYICAGCFTRAADERLIDWTGRVRFVPLSLAAARLTPIEGVAASDMVLVPREATEAMLEALHHNIRIRVSPADSAADILNEREVWASMLAAALSTPPATSPAIPEGKSGDGVGRREAICRAMFEADPAVGTSWDDWVAYANAHPTFQQDVDFVRRQADAVLALSKPNATQTREAELVAALGKARDYVERKSHDAFDDREHQLLGVIDAALNARDAA